MWAPDGFEADGTTKKFKHYIAQRDFTYYEAVGDTVKTFPVYANIKDGQITNIHRRGAARSGTIVPDNYNGAFYNTDTNIITQYNSGVLQEYTSSFPIGIATSIAQTGNNISTIDQVFNGFGYIGSCSFLLPGLKYLGTFGRDDAGNDKSKSFEVSSVKVSANLGSSVGGVFWVGLDTKEDGTISYMGTYTNRSITSKTKPNVINGCWFNPETAETHYINADGVVSTQMVSSIRYALITVSGGQINDWKVIEQPFEAVNRWDGAFLSAQSMPSTKYIDLTLGASDSTYTAPANGWLVFKKSSTAAKQEMRLTNMTKGELASFSTSTWDTPQELGTYIPACKGDRILVYYTTGGATSVFRFIYAEGEV